MPTILDNMEYHSLKVFLLVILATCTTNTNAAISKEQKTSIEKGLEAGNVLAEVLKEGNFRDSLVKLGKYLAPFLGVLGPLSNIALSFIPTKDSKEMDFMKKKFKEVSNKLDIITSEFEEVKNAIEWNVVVRNSYGVYERKIRAAEANLNRIYEVQGQAREHERKNFIIQYESDFGNSLQKLYDAIINNDHVFSKNILDAAVKHTKNHKRKVEQFSLGLVQLLVQAIKVKVSYYGMKGWTGVDVTKSWTAKMKRLKDRLQSLSDQVKGRYKRQLRTDADDLILRHHGLGNKGLMQKIYDFVKTKYDWRYWFVAVYDNMYGYDDHTISLCGGYSLLHQQGKNIIISSQDKVHSSKFKQSDAANLLKGVENDINECSLRNPGDRARALVNNVRNKAGNICVPYALVMAVRIGKGLRYISPNAHEAYRKIDKTKECCLRKSWGSSRNYICNCGGRGCRCKYECKLYGRPISCVGRCKSVSWHHDMFMFG